MLHLLKQTLVCYLILFLVLLPCPSESYAAAVRSVAVVEVYERTPTEQLSKMHLKIEGFLSARNDIKVMTGSPQTIAPPSRIIERAEPPAENKQLWTKGDEDYTKAKDLHLNSNFSGAISKVRSSISLLMDNPGISGNLYNAHILKAQIEYELGNDDAALQSLMKAISLDVENKNLNASSLSPSMRFIFNNARKSFMQSNQLIDMTINVESGEIFPIYVNGILRGSQSSLTIQVPRNTPQVISVGNNIRKHIARAARRDNIVVVSAYTQETPIFSEPTEITSYHPLGLIYTFFPTLVSQAQVMGRDMNANHVAMIKVDPASGTKKSGKTSSYQMLLSVVDTRDGQVSPAQLYHIPDIEIDADRIAKMASDYIASLQKVSFASVNANYWTATQVAALQKGMELTQMNVGGKTDDTQKVAALKTAQKTPDQGLGKIPDPKKAQKTGEQPTDETTVGQKKSKTMMYAIIGAAVVVVGGGIAAALALSGGGGGTTITEPTATGNSSTILTGPVPITPPP